MCRSKRRVTLLVRAYVLPKSLCCSPDSSVMAFGGKAFRRLLGFMRP